MNKVILMGRLTRDPEVRYSQEKMPWQSPDIHWQLTADSVVTEKQLLILSTVFLSDGQQSLRRKYFRQGLKIAVTGRIQTGSYTNREGQKVYTTEVVVEDQEFAESKASSDSYAASHPRTEAAPAPSMPSPSAASADGFMNIPDGIDEELPFN